MTSFRQFKLIYKRELGALLTTPLYFVLTGIFFLLTSFIYLMLLMQFAQGTEKEMSVNVTEAVIVPTFYMVHFFLIVQVPLLTMRVFAEDEGNGMLDLIQTTPVRDWSLVLGKFAATATGLGLYVLATASFPITTSFLGLVEWPVIIGSILALLFAASAYVAIGLFFSSTTESQVVAAVLSYVTLFIFIFISALVENTGISALDDAARHFSVTEHIKGLLSGDIVPMNVVYFIALCVIFLFLSARILEARRWRA